MGNVHHVECQHGRQTQLHQLQRQVQGAAQVACINHINHHFGALVYQKVARYALFERKRCQAVCARQIHRFYSARLIAVDAVFFINRHARVIGNVLPRACKHVKKRGFARVLLACQGNQQALFLRLGLGLGLGFWCSHGYAAHFKAHLDIPQQLLPLGGAGKCLTRLVATQSGR